jgi:hypothetical protein
MPLGSVSRVYADVLQSKPQQYWDYDIHEITWGYVNGCPATEGLRLVSARNASFTLRRRA